VTLEQADWELPVRVSGFSGVDPAEEARLSGLGLAVGAVVTKLMPTPLRDPVECLVGSQLLALERRLLARVRVEAA
jgi:Fe2+ transport system protein FeoA